MSKEIAEQLAEAKDQLNLVLSFFSRVDAKLSIVFALDTGVLAVVASKTPAIGDLTCYMWAALSTFGLIIAISLVFWYRGTFPHLKGGRHSLVYFREIADRTEHAFIDEFKKQTTEDRTSDVLAQVWRNSEILKKKFDALKVAFILTAVALAPWAISLLLFAGQKTTLFRNNMALKDDLQNDTDEITTSVWDRRDGTVIPDSTDVGLGNDAVDLDATFLYADLADSTEMVSYDQSIAAEVMKAYLKGATRIIRAKGGKIRSFDGDRVMGVFIGETKNTSAAKAGLEINYFFQNILVPAFSGIYSNTFPAHLKLKQTVGIDTSTVMAVRAGIRDNNDLVWVGRAPNLAAKLSSIREDGYSTYITKSVFDVLHESAKTGGSPARLMWESRSWAAGNAYGVGTVYRSGWTWQP